jgi:hypothetical protein
VTARSKKYILSSSSTTAPARRNNPHLFPKDRLRQTPRDLAPNGK